MPVNHYFNNYNSQIEQWLIEDLIVESIQIMGFDAYYIPISNISDRDIIYGEDPLKRFSGAYPVEMYLSDAMDPGLEKDFFSKFGLQIQNTTRVILSRRSFSYRIPQTQTRPLEGDLVYVPFLKGTGELYEIKFVNVTKDFYMLGRKYPYFYELELESFKYSQEQIDTGIPDIDLVASLDSYSLDFTMNAGGSGNYKEKEIVYQGTDSANATAFATVTSWHKPSKTLTLTNISGEFDANVEIIGAQSSASYILNTFDPLELQFRNPFDNKEIEEESIIYVDTEETNAFGNLG